MNNVEYHKQYIEAMRRLHGTGGKHICLRHGCTTMCLGDYCLKHITGEASPPRQQPEEQ
jgi:hypothetical protein